MIIIAIAVGTGVGKNAVLSRSLGEVNKEKADRVVGNGIFLMLCFYVVFLLFGIFGTRPFIAMQANGDEQVIEMGTEYLTICCCLSIGAIALRLAVFVLPVVWLFTLVPNPQSYVWWAFPISEIVTAAVSVWICIATYRKRIKTI